MIQAAHHVFREDQSWAAETYFFYHFLKKIKKTYISPFKDKEFGELPPDSAA